MRVSLSADTANFEQGMRRAQRQAQSSASGIQKSMGLIKAGVAGLVSGLSIGLFVNAIKGALDYAGSLGEVSQQLGVTTRDLQVFRYAAGQVGVSQQQLETGLSKLTITLGKVAAGAKAPAAALNAIGVSTQQLKGKDTGEAFRIIADGLEKITDRSQRAAVEVALFGKSGAQLDNLLSGGSRAVNELADAADRLGIVLSDEQIQKADDTADKLEALKTVISARIAGAVADNADAILGLANALADLVGSIGTALRAWANFRAQINAGLLEMQGMGDAAARARGSAFVSDQNPTVPGSKVTVKLGPAKPFKAPTTGGANIGKFLAGGGGRSSRGKKDNSAEEALRKQISALGDANRFDQDLRRAQMDVLGATRDLSTDYVERATLSSDLLLLEKSAYEAQLKYETELYKLTKGEQGLSEVQAAQLKIEFDKKNALEAQKVIAEERAQKQEDSARLDDLNFDLEKDRLQSQEQLARTASEQRDIQLRLLDLSYRQEKARLEAVLADEQATEYAKEDARRRLANLSQTFSNDRSAVLQNTQGPMEQFLSQVPRNAAEAQEAMEQLQVQGIEGAIDSIIALQDGFDSFRDTALSAIKQVIAQLIRMQLMKTAMSLFSAGASTSTASLPTIAGGSGSIGSLPAFATGGSMKFAGIGGTDKNLLSLNGLPIARVSRGEMMHIVPEGKSMGGGGMSVNAPITIMGNATRETTKQIGVELSRKIADARKAGY